MASPLMPLNRLERMMLEEIVTCRGQITLLPVSGWLIVLAIILPTAASGVSQSSQRSSQTTTLELGRPLENEIAAGQKQSYEINLPASDYVRVIVEQRGIDIVARLFGPDQKSLAEVDSENRLSGREIVEWVAAAGGAYRIEIAPRYKSVASGRYEIQVAELRSANDDDRKLDEARNLHAQARREYIDSRYDEAIRIEQQSLIVRQQILGTDQPDVASSLFALGLYYRNAGEIPEAEDSYLRALGIREKALGAEHPDVGITLHNLAYLYYYDLRDYAQSQSMYERALAIKQKAFGPEHPQVAATLLNMGLLYWKKKDYARAEDHFQRALEIFRKNDGPDSNSVANCTHNLGIVYKESGDYAKGEAYYRQAVAIWEKVDGKDHSLVALGLESIGILFRDKGDYQTAEPFLQRALDIEIRKEGATHPDVANTLVILARLFEAKGDTARAVEYQTRAAEIEEKNIERNLSLGSERQKLAYFSSMSNEGDRRLSLHLHSAPDNPKARDLALTMVIQRKGRVLDALADTTAALRRSLSVSDQTLVDRLNDLTAKLAHLVLEGPANESAVEHERNVAALEIERDKLEEELSRRTANFFQPSRPATIDALRRQLPDNAALIEFAIYHPSDARVALEHDTPGEPRYVAYVIRKQGDVQWKELGAAKEIDAATNAFREALNNPASREVQQRARTVDEKVMQPVREVIGDATQLLVSPDGLLNLIPFAALVDEQGRYLIERYAIAYLTSARDLSRLQARQKSKTGPVVVADPDFGAPPLVAAAMKPTGNPTASRARVDYSQIFFGPLPGVTDEVRALKVLLPQGRFLTKDQASKAALEKVSGPSILHIATHGFFLSVAGEAPTRPGSRIKTRSVSATTKIDNPLLRSGLALAGANQNDGKNDGILTALEASGLDLLGTKLVVLSACDTGLGEVRNGDGVYGLRRALVLAGAESQLMSLWPVSDRSTRDLMINYYRNLISGLGRGDSLRRAQLQILQDRSHSHPYYWASFIQTGEWANLDGKR